MKKLLFCFAMVAVLSFSALFTVGAADQKIVLTVAHVAVEGQFHPYNEGLKKMQEVLDAKTGGRVKLKIYAGGSLSSDEKEMLNMIKNDSLDMAIVAPSPLATFSPMISILGLPYIFKSLDHAEAMMSGEVGKVMRDELVKKNFYPLSYWIGKGFRSVNSSKRPVVTPADLKGQKVRVMEDPAYIDAFKAFGANPVPIAWGELHTSLQTRTVDAHENDPPVINDYGFIEFAKYFSLTEHSLMPIVVVMKASKLNALEPEVKAALLEAADAARTVSRKTADTLLQTAYAGIKKQGGIINEVDKEAFFKLAKPVVESYKTKFGQDGARLIEIMLK